MEIIQIILIAVVLVLIVGIIWVLVKINARTGRFADTQTIDTLSQRLQEVDNSSRQSFERLAGTLGELAKATEQMMEVGKTISSIEDLLKPPKLRGGLGETLLEQLLSQILPP